MQTSANMCLRSLRSASLFLWFGALSVVVLFFGVVPDVFGQVAFDPGTFQGLLQSDSDNDESFGFITIVLTRSGSFTARFNLGVNQIGHHSYSKTGRFDTNGAYHFEGPEVTDTRYAIARIIDLQLDNVSAPTAIHGTVTDLTHSSTVELERVAVFSSVNPAPQLGRYTFLFSGSGDSGLPPGHGYGTITVNRSGRISASGKAPDGMTFSRTASLTVNNRWPFFTTLGGKTHGILSGWLDFEETATTDFAGELTWLGPEEPGPNNAFVPEFSGTVSVAGSRYVPPVGAILQTATSTNNVHLSISGGGLETPSERDLTLTAGNRFIFSPRLTGDALTANRSKGTFTGKFLHSDGRAVTFRGAVLQKQNIGGGHFVDRNDEAGTVLLSPIN